MSRNVHPLSGRLLGLGKEIEAEIEQLCERLTADATRQFDEPMKVVVRVYVMPKGRDVAECILAEAGSIMAELEVREKTNATTH